MLFFFKLHHLTSLILLALENTGRDREVLVLTCAFLFVFSFKLERTQHDRRDRSKLSGIRNAMHLGRGTHTGTL